MLIFLLDFFLFFILVCGVCADSGFATYYTRASCAREGNHTGLTASGRPYDESALTCARRSREFGHFFCISNSATGKSIIVKQIDYGPGNGPTAKGIIIDLTPAAFCALGADLRQGKIKVTVKEIHR